MDISSDALDLSNGTNSDVTSVDITNLSDNWSDTESLISIIQSLLKEQLSRFENISNDKEYIRAAHDLPDEVLGILKKLSICDMESYSLLWLLTVGEVLRAVFMVTSYLDGQAEPSAQVSYAVTSMMPSLNEFCLYLENLVKSWKPPSLNSFRDTALEKTTTYFYRTLALTCDWLTTGLRIVHDEKCFHLILERITQAHVELSPELQGEIFSALTSFSRAAFLCGYPELVLDIDEQVASVGHAISLLLSSKIEFNTLMDFCRYMGYSLVSCSVSSERIEQSLCNRADVLFGALLGLPNLQIVNYSIRQASDTTTTASPKGSTSFISPQRHISVKEREELSFFYVINSILRMNTLSQFVSTSERFKNECNFLMDSLHERVSQALDILASAPHSQASSIVSLPAFESQSRNTLRPRASMVMSSILEDGTYKEKLILVLSFFQSLSLVHGKGTRKSTPGQIIKLVQSFSASGLSHSVDLHTKLTNDDIVMLISKIDKFKYPGKAIFVEALRKIVNLCQLLFLKHVFSSMNLKEDPYALLWSTFQTQVLLEEVLDTKPLLVLNYEGALEYCPSSRLLAADQLKEYSKCLDWVAMLEELV